MPRRTPSRSQHLPIRSATSVELPVLSTSPRTGPRRTTLVHTTAGSATQLTTRRSFRTTKAPLEEALVIRCTVSDARLERASLTLQQALAQAVVAPARRLSRTARSNPLSRRQTRCDPATLHINWGRKSPLVAKFQRVKFSSSTSRRRGNKKSEILCSCR